MTLFSNNQDIFQTQADNRFNSFSDPMNSVGMNGGTNGGWGMDQNYLTPSYLSPFRPRYQGSTGDASPGFNPGLGTSLDQVINPFASGGSNYGGNYWSQTTPFYNSLGNRPSDAAASLIQNWIVPGVAVHMAYAHLGGASSRIGASMASGLTRGLFSGAMGAKGVSTAMAGAGMVGGAIGGLALPAFAAQVAVDAFDSAFMDPYIAQRKMGNNLRENFAGITFGETGAGDPFTGGGLSRRMAASISKNNSLSATREMTFNQNEVAQLSDFASRSGLMDNVNSTQMASRFESILKQVKVVMSVANTSDFKETIGIMSKMQMSGVASSQLAGIMGQMASGAAIGGHSVQKVMNTTGAQGQYMFGAAGLTPYLGQLSAFSSGGSIAAAFRSNLISPALMARMGGQEGATQSAVAAQLAAYKTPYANMMASNAYLGGGETGDVVGNVSRFGSMISKNPLENIGNHLMNGNALASAHLRDRGLAGEQDMIQHMAKTMYGSGALDDKGKVKEGVAYMIMTNQMGHSHEMATAKLAELRSYRDPDTVKQMLAANSKASTEARLNYQTQEGLDAGIFTGPKNYVKTAWLGVQEFGARKVGYMNADIADLSDSFQASWNTSRFQISEGGTEGLSFEKFDQRNSPNKQFDLSGIKLDKDFNVKGTAFMDSNTVNDLKAINRAAKSNSSAAAYIALDNKNTPEGSRLLAKLVKDGVIDKEYMGSAKADALNRSASKVGVLDSPMENLGKYSTAEDFVTDKLVGKNGVLPGGEVKNALEFGRLVNAAYAKYQSGDKVSDKEIGEINALISSNDKIKNTPQALSELHKKLQDNTAPNGSGNYFLSKATSATGVVEDLRRKNLPLASASVTPSPDQDATAAQVLVQQGIEKKRAEIYELNRKQKISNNEAQGALNALDNGTAVGAFAEQVNKFGLYVKEFGGSKADPTVGPNTAANSAKGTRTYSNK